MNFRTVKCPNLQNYSRKFLWHLVLIMTIYQHSDMDSWFQNNEIWT